MSSQNGEGVMKWMGRDWMECFMGSWLKIKKGSIWLFIVIDVIVETRVENKTYSMDSMLVVKTTRSKQHVLCE